MMRHRYRSSFRLACVLALLASVLAGCAQAGTTSRTARAGASPTAAASPTSTATPIPPPPAPQIAAGSALLMDTQTGAVLFSQNANAEVAMASTTKIMTAVVALTYGNANTPVTIGPDAVAMQNGQDSVANLRLGDTLPLSDMLYALLLPSGDDAAVAIAHTIAGSQAGFVHLMNQEAFLLGLFHTHYANVHGLDEAGHYTTAMDLARLTRFAMRIPLFAQVVRTATYTLPATARHGAYTWINTNELLAMHPYPGADGVKTGFTGNAGYCLVFSAVRGGVPLLGVLLGEQTYEGRFTDAAALLNWGYSIERPKVPAAG